MSIPVLAGARISTITVQEAVPGQGLAFYNPITQDQEILTALPVLLNPLAGTIVPPEVHHQAPGAAEAVAEAPQPEHSPAGVATNKSTIGITESGKLMPLFL
jgi:hypothetical protein